MDPRESMELVSCPIDPVHRMLPHRLNQHLIKCRRNQPKSKLVTCSFNSTHIVAEQELQYHYEHCLYRKQAEAQIIRPDATEKYPMPPPDQFPNCDENWDEDWDKTPTYNPQEYAERSNVRRCLSVASKGQRKDFRQRERQRLQQLNETTNDVNQTDVKCQSEQSHIIDCRRQPMKIQLPEHRPLPDVDIMETVTKNADKIFTVQK